MPLLGQQPTMPLKRVSQGNFLSRTMLKHNVVFHQGSRGDAAYILIRGKIEISGTVDERKKVFAIINPISIFGEMALFLDDQTRTATATALEDSEVIVVTRDDLDDYMRTAPQVISSILTVLVSRLKTTTKKAMRVPSVPMGIVRTLDLFAANGCMDLEHGHAVRTLMETLVAPREKVEGYIANMASQGFLSLAKNDKGKLMIHINHVDLLNQVIKKSTGQD